MLDEISSWRSSHWQGEEGLLLPLHEASRMIASLTLATHPRIRIHAYLLGKSMESRAFIGKCVWWTCAAGKGIK